MLVEGDETPRNELPGLEVLLFAAAALAVAVQAMAMLLLLALLLALLFDAVEEHALLPLLLLSPEAVVLSVLRVVCLR